MTYCLDRVHDERVEDFMCVNGWPRYVEVPIGEPGFGQEILWLWALFYVGCIVVGFIDWMGWLK